MLNLSTDITKISRVGMATAKKLKKLGIETVHDLLFYFPFRYDDFSKITPIVDLKPGVSANVVGQIELIQNKRSPRRRMYITEAIVSDGTESVKVIWFNQPFIGRNLRVGDYVSLAGKVEEDFGGPVMMAPAYEKILWTNADWTRTYADKSPLPPFVKGSIHTQGLVSNYHLTANLTHKQVRFLIRQIIQLAEQIEDWLSAKLFRKLLIGRTKRFAISNSKVCSIEKTSALKPLLWGSSSLGD